jgi:tetratricopeptide (TPR) repeat protein
MSGSADQHVQAGLALEAEGRTQRAEREYRKALDIAPHHVAALNNLGQLLSASGRAANAAPYFERAIKAAPGDVISWTNLGGALRETGNEEGALDAFARALTLNPFFGGARLNLANLLRSQGRLEEARPHYRFLLERNPNDGLARWNLAALEGLAGNVDAAFALFAQVHAQEPASPPPALARWRGEPLDGKRILLEANQGLGDTIMFARFVASVHDRGGRVMLRAQPALDELLSCLSGLDRFVSRDDAVPQADVWFPLVDLPAVLGKGAARGPWPSPYLSAAPERIAHWAPQLAESGRARVGIAWAGNPTHPDDRNRSLPLKALFGPLSKLRDIEFISLQLGDAQAQAKWVPAIRSDIDVGNFADTAAVLSHLDLVISVDTSILHLAGALGRPAWGLLAYAPDWRWMLTRSDSPWYPSLTLFRQPRPRDWDSVAKEVATALTAFAAARNPLHESHSRYQPST